MKKPQVKNIMSASAMQGGHNNRLGLIKFCLTNNCWWYNWTLWWDRNAHYMLHR